MLKILAMISRCMSAFFIVSLILLIQLLFIKEYLGNITHLEISNTRNGRNIIVKDVQLSTRQNLAGLRIIFSNIYLKSNINQLKVVDNAHISIQLDLIYKKLLGQNKDDPIFHIHVNGLDVKSIMTFNSTIHNSEKQLYSENNSKIVASIVRLLNRRVGSDFKLQIDFKEFELSSSFGNIAIKKVAFENLTKNHSGKIMVLYALNGQQNTVQGIILRDKTDNRNNKSELFSSRSESDNTNLILELYGYVTHNLPHAKYTVKPDGFYKILFTYDISNNDIGFNFNLDAINLTMPSIPSISCENVMINGRYHLENKTLFVKNFKFDLSSLGRNIPINGSLSIDSNGELDIVVKSNAAIEKEIIYSLWPNKYYESMRFIQSLVVNTMVTEPHLSVKSFVAPDGKYQFKKLDLSFRLKDTTLSRKMNRYNHKISSSDGLVKIDLDRVQIQSRVASLDMDIEIKDLDLSFYFDTSKKILCNLELNSSINSITRIANYELDKEFEDSRGNMKLRLKSQLPARNFRLSDVILSGSFDLRDVSTVYKNKKYKLSGEKILFELKKNRLNAVGNLKYNDINIKNLEFKGELSTNKSSQPHLRLSSVDFKLDVNQPLVQLMINKTQSKADGVLNVAIADFSDFSLNLENVRINNDILNIAKQPGVVGGVDFTLENNAEFKNINVSLPNMELSGAINLSNEEIESLNFKFTTLHNSSFNMHYSKENNTYKIDGAKLHFEDIKMILDNFKSHEKISNSSFTETRFIINLDLLYFNKQPILEDVYLNLNFQSGKLKKIDGYGYAKNKSGYIRIFFDEPAFGLIVNDLGYVMEDIGVMKSLKKGSLGLYLTASDITSNPKISGDLYLYNFKLIESYLLSTILKIYALSGFGVTNIFQMFNNGVNFSNMHCLISSDSKSILFDNCQAFSNAMLLNLEGKMDFNCKKGEVQGMIIPKNFFNTPIIFLQQVLSRKGKTLLDDIGDKQNFSISWKEGQKPIIRTNPMSFILPSIFSNLFSKTKTVREKKTDS